MLMLTTILLLLAGLASGLARRSWWEIGALTLIASGFLQGVDLWLGDWRDQVGLPGDERPFTPLTIAWLLVGVYVTYALAFVYSCWRLPTGPHSDR
jgi:hypothetical protein